MGRIGPRDKRYSRHTSLPFGRQLLAPVVVASGPPLDDRYCEGSSCLKMGSVDGWRWIFVLMRKEMIFSGVKSSIIQSVLKSIFYSRWYYLKESTLASALLVFF